MGNMHIRKIPDEVHRAIKVQAKANARSAEEEVRTILAKAVLPEDEPRAGDMLWEIWDGLDLPEDVFARDRTPYEPIDLD